ncbi:eukaryotic translation initiation factor 4 gamma 1 isoform X9 [Cephus cinctus]|nr:eukaryotic translation initiation factor 4 gamma 1 isoform X9 [Cephus cinctus]
MGKQAHLQAQPPSLQQVYMPNQTRPTSQGYYQPGPRPQQPRGLNHRSQGGAAQVVGMPGVGAGGAQPTAMYSHHGSIAMQPGAMYLQGQVSSLHTGPHQQGVYPMNNQMPIQVVFTGPPQRHQGHQNQSFYQSYPPALLAQNMFGFTHGPAPQHGYYYQTPSAPINLGRPGAGAVSGGAQHVGGPLAGAQGATVVPQGTIPQPTQQPQPIPPMAIPLTQTDVYSGHNGGVTNVTNSVPKYQKRRRENAIDIVDPKTGKKINEDLSDNDTATQSGESSNRETPQPQNCSAEVVAEFAARVAKVAAEDTKSGSPVPASISEATVTTAGSIGSSNSSANVVTSISVTNTAATSTASSPASQNASQSPQNLKVQSNQNNDTNSNLCNISSPMPTQSIPSVTTPLSSQSLGTSSNALPVEAYPAKTESKPLHSNVKEFHPRSETKHVIVPEEYKAPTLLPSKDNVPAQTATSSAQKVTEVDVSPTTVDATSTGVPQATAVPANLPIPNVAEVPSVPVAPVAVAATSASTVVPVREPFPSLASKNSSSSPPRRKTQSQSAVAALVDLPPSGKEQKERKTSEKSSRGATPTPAYQPEHHEKANGETSVEKQESDVPANKNDAQQKTADGKATQKQKNKGKLKRDINRKGAEKEGTDMDAFVNVAPTAKPEIKQQQQPQEIKDIEPTKDSNNEAVKEISREAKEKEDKESEKQTSQTESVVVAPEIPKESTPVQQSPVVEKPVAIPNNKEQFKEPSPTIEDNAKTQEVCKMPVKTATNDVVDHAKITDEIELESVIVAQKNEENSKVSALGATSREQQPETPVIEKQNENEPPNQIDSTPKGQPTLKYTYKDDQWSPLNMSGKKVYDREFLMNLQEDPNSKIKPLNLPDLEVVLKDNTRSRSTMDLKQFKDPSFGRHDLLFPGFAKGPMNTRVPPLNKRSHPGKPKTNKPNVIHVSLSLREDVKLRETENAWRPARLKSGDIAEEDGKTEDLYKRVRGVLNKLTPEKFDKLVGQVRSLPIDTQEKLQGVIDLVFEKAVDEPSFSVAYALMCKELGMMEVNGGDKKTLSGRQESSGNFRKLIITRCQMEFEKNSADESARVQKLKEIEECTDPDKKKELQATFEEEERRIRVKSVGNIRFIGELFKQSMLTSKIMHTCIQHLLSQPDEESLECLCKLLTTVGKGLESKGPSYLSPYFEQMRKIANQKGPGKVSSRVRFMLQDVIDLRANKWVPRRDDSNPKTIDQIQKEAESERLDMQLNNTPLNTPRKDDRNNDRKRNRAIGGSVEDGWSQPISRTRQPYSVETSKLKNKPPPMDDLQLGSRNVYMWKNPVPISKTITPNKYACLDTSDQDKQRMPLQLSGSRSTGPREYGRTDYKSSYEGRSSRNGNYQMSRSGSSSRENSLLDGSRSQSISMPPPTIKAAPQPATPSSNKPPMSEEKFIKILSSILEEYVSEYNVEYTVQEIRENFDSSFLAKFVSESINIVLEKSTAARERVSKLFSQLILQNVLPLTLFRSGFSKVLELADDLIIDIPKIWTYFAELFSQVVEEGAHPLSEMKLTLATLRSQGHAGKLMGELLAKLSRDKGPKWVSDKWDQSGLKWSDIVDESRENVDAIIKDYKLEFLTGDCKSLEAGSGSQLTMEQIHEQLRNLMKENSFDEICSWITANVGDRAKEPQFIRVLVTAILEVSIEQNRRINMETFKELETLIQRYVDANDKLELQCLFAIQAYIHKIEHPSGVLLQIISALSDQSILSCESFIAWENDKTPSEFEGKAVAMKSLTSFFTALKEADDSGEEA